MKVVIVGNGVLGLQTAYQLAQEPTVHIEIVGDFAHTGCASLAAAAMFNSFCEIDGHTFRNPFEEKKWLFNKMSNSYWPALLERLKADSGLPLNSGFGTYLINNTASDNLEDENFDAIALALQKFAEPHKFVSPRDIPHYNPLPALRATRAVLVEREGWVNPYQLLESLKAVLQRNKNVKFTDALCEKINFEKSQISSVGTNKGIVTGEKFVLCPGANFSKIIGASKLPVKFQRIFYGVGSTVLLKTGAQTLPSCIRTPNRGLACGVYAAPQDKEHTVVGASNLIAPEPFPSARTTSIYTLLKSAMEQINTEYYKTDFVRANLGWRPTSSDTLPLIGRAEIQNLFIATGTKRDGLHCSPVISIYLKDLILKGESPVTKQFDFDLFKPDRKPHKVFKRAEAVELLVHQTMNAAYQHDFVPAKNNMRAELENYYRAQYETLHDQVGVHDFGIPPELKDMFKYGHLSPDQFE